ncbi:MAG TPA: cohesin domain-containing protein [Dehalococcoidia bacterium]|nr:cohesin domain-containing protein [Dehalococcoidia bacterium]
MWRKLLLAAVALAVTGLLPTGRGEAQSPQVSVGVATAPPGSTAIVAVGVSPDPQAPLGAVVLRIGYDPSRLRASAFSPLAEGVLVECDLSTQGQVRCGLLHATGMSGQVMSLTFQVLSQAAPGVVPLTLTVDECFTAQGQGANCLRADGAVVVQSTTTPPPPPLLVAIRPLSATQALISWLPPSGTTHYLLRSALNYEMTMGVRDTTLPVESLPLGNALTVGVPEGDGLTFYYQLAACNQAGCSPFVRAGGLARRMWPGAADWNFYLAAYDFVGTTTAWAFNASPVPGKESVMAFYDGIQGFGAAPRGQCPLPVPPGSACTRSWAGGSAFASASQSFPPFGEVGAALRVR